MASSKDYLEYVLEQLSEAGDVTSLAMMSEYILYFRGKVIGGIYDRKAGSGGAKYDAGRTGGTAV